MSGPVLDLFRGAGGWSLAAQAKGLDDYGVEKMAEANATAALAGFKTAFRDVWEPPVWLTEEVWLGLIASPPCQTFSVAGKGKGREALDTVLRAIKDERWRSIEDLRALAEEVGDERTALVLTPLYYASLLLPEWIALEQVPAVLPVWEAMAEVLRNLGYNVWTGNLHAEQYGVPQTRKRAVLIASRVREVHQPVPTHSRYYARSPERLDDGVLPWVSMAEALGWAEGAVMVSNYGTGGDPRNRGTRTGTEPAPTATSKIDRNKIEWAMGTTNVRDGEYQSRDANLPAPTITAAARSYRWGAPPLVVETPGKKGGNMQENRVTTDGLPDWCYNRPSTTIVGSFKPEVVAAPGYRTTVSRQNAPDSARVTAQEAGILQSFPAGHPWQGSKTKQYLQVGNAIPPLLARAILDVVQP